MIIGIVIVSWFLLDLLLYLFLINTSSSGNTSISGGVIHHGIAGGSDYVWSSTAIRSKQMKDNIDWMCIIPQKWHISTNFLIFEQLFYCIPHKYCAIFSHTMGFSLGQTNQ